MRLCNFLVGASVAGVLLTACTTDEITIPKSELYAREFIKKFGVIDPDRDFNAATRSGVTVITGRPTDVKVYADINGKRYIFAEGRKISGTTPLTFDVPKSVKEVLVDAGGRITKASLGSTVRIASSSRADESDETTDETDVTDGPGTSFCNNSVTYYKTKPKIFLAQDIIDIVKVLPEEKPNTNVEGIVADFYFQAEAGQQMTFYPLYWNTSSHHSLGIYWLDEELGFHWAELGEKPGEYEYAPVTLVYNNYMQDLYQTRSGRLLECKDYNPETSTDEDFLPVSGQQCSFSQVYNNIVPETSNTAFKAVGVTLKFEKPLKFGFFLKTASGQYNAYEPDENGFVATNLYGYADHIFFSQARRNQYFGRILQDSQFNLYMKDDVIEEVSLEDQTIKYFNKNGEELSFPYGYKKIQFNGDSWNIVSNQTNRWGSVAVENFWKGENNYSRAAYVSLPVKDDDGNVLRKRTYFAFEDWSNGPIDLNDLVFIMDSEVQAYDENDDPIPDDDPLPEPEVYQWLIAAEDLAGTYDWDFNDAVFAVSATTIVDGEDNNATKTEITVEPLAAGGTLPIYVMFNGDISVENGEGTLENLGGGHYTIGQELHRWLGGYYRTPINVKDAVATATGKPLKFTVDGEWSLTDKYQNNPSWAQQQDVKGMGGFYVLVNPGNTLNLNESKIAKFEGDLNDENHFHKVTPPSSFNKQDQVVVAPEMLCLETHWCWPQEEQPIHEVYYNFEQWLKGEATDWYSSAGLWESTRVVTRK